MPKQEDWVLLQKSNFASYDAFKDNMQNKYKVKIGKNNSKKCSKSTYDFNLHMRRYILGSCGGVLCNKDKPCIVRYKILKCSSAKALYIVHRLNEHEEISDAKNNFIQQSLPSNTKILIASMIDKEGMMYAQNCHLKLIKMLKKNCTITLQLNFQYFKLKLLI